MSATLKHLVAMDQSPQVSALVTLVFEAMMEPDNFNYLVSNVCHSVARAARQPEQERAIVQLWGKVCKAGFLFCTYCG